MSYEEPRQVKPARVSAPPNSKPPCPVCEKHPAEHQHSTLAARDAYAARGGWHSERQATSITYHSRWGQVARHTVTPEMLDETT